MSDLEQQLAAIEASDLSGPAKLARICELTIPDLIAKRDAATDPRERRKLERRVRTNRRLLRFAKSRVGYLG